jgi:hypothetical protein
MIVFQHRICNNQRGQALVLVLILLLVAGLIVAPLLQFMGTGIKASITHENKMDELYAADAGIEDAKWQVKSGNIETDNVTFPNYGVYKFGPSDIWPYSLSQPVNGITPVNVTIQNVWIPRDIPNIPPSFPDETTALNIIESQKLVVTGTTVGTSIHSDNGTHISQFKMRITYLPDASDLLVVEQIGAWLPPGFSYFSDSHHMSNLETLSGIYRAIPIPFIPWAGNEVRTWTFSSSPKFSQFPTPPLSTGSAVKTLEITFYYKPDDQSVPDAKPDIITWIKTSGVADIPYAWDADIRVFKLTSTAGNTTVETYLAKNELRKLEAAVAGDYLATGNTLLTPQYSSATRSYYRDYLLKESSATVRTATDNTDRKGIPANATVEFAYLYWSGWQETGAAGTTLFSDDCSSFTQASPDIPGNNSWIPGGIAAGSQQIVPINDAGGDSRGIFTASTGSSLFETINEITPNNNDYMLCAPTSPANSPYYRLFISPFSVPSGATITGITVYVTARDNSSGTNDIRPCIKVNNTLNFSSSNDPPDSDRNYRTYSSSWNNNPATGTAWRVDDINGSGTRPLQQFGVYSSDLSPSVRVSAVYAEVTWSGTSLWSVSSNQFRCIGSNAISTDPIRYLALSNAIDLGSYPAGRVQISWSQSFTGLSSSDRFYYALSSDGGSYTEFEANKTNGTFNVPADIIDRYAGHRIKVRFRANFSSGSSKYVDIDNITVIGLEDPVVARKVNRVSFTSGNVTSQITADDWTTVPNEGIEPAWSYSCFKDVTGIINDVIDDGGLAANAAGRYTVGHVIDDSGPTPYNLRSPTTYGIVDTTDYPLSIPAADFSSSKYQYTYAGWSLVIIYSSPETQGHQLYLFDQHNGYFNFMNTSTVLTLNITGFIAPPSTAGSHLTYFIGEGDNHYAYESMTVNGYRLPVVGDPYEVPSINPQSNIFNSYSNSLDNPYLSGVDIDTFDMSSCISAGSTSATLVLDPGEMLDLVYIILSFRSETTTSGAFTYIIR